MRSHEKIKEGIPPLSRHKKNALTDHSCLNVAQSSMTQSQISLEAIDLSRNAVSPIRAINRLTDSLVITCGLFKITI
jgi:hypothetical protein